MKKTFLLFIIIICHISLLSQTFEEKFVEEDISEIIEKAFSQFENTHFSEEDIAHWANYLSSNIPTVGTVNHYMNDAADEFQIPVVLLQAIGQVESNWTQIGPSIDKGWGIMHLVENGYSNTLEEASSLLNLPKESLKRSAKQNIRGMAALLSHYRKDKKIKNLSDWFDIVMKVTGLKTKDLRELQAKNYFDVIQNGIRSKTLWGEDIEIPAAKEEFNLSLNLENPFFKTNKGTTLVDYPDAIQYLTPCNYTYGRAGYAIDTWTNHWIGVGTYAGSISWFHNCSAEVSAHFVISKDGEITQVVDVDDKAWHAGAYGTINNQRSIGVEHEATLTNPTYWNNEAMLQASTKMARFFCDLYRIPKERNLPGIRGHQEMPGTSTQCPGTLPWDKWMNYLNSDKNIVLYLPENENNAVLSPTEFVWSSPEEANQYRIQVSDSKEGFNPDSTIMFPHLLLNETVDSNYFRWAEAQPNTEYFWTVQHFRGDSILSTSSFNSFITVTSNENYPYLSVSNLIIQDVFPHGNNNGIVEAGEEISLSIALSNENLIEALNISAKLIDCDNDVIVLNDEGTWNNISPSGVVYSTNFSFKVSPYAKAKPITFILELTANQNQFTTSFNLPIICHIPSTHENIFGDNNICIDNCETFVITQDENVLYSLWDYSGETDFNGKNDTMEICPSTNGILKAKRFNMCGESDWKGIEINLKDKPESPHILFSNDTLFCSEGENYEWYHNHEIIENEEGYFLIPKFNGLYYAKIVKDGCSSDPSNYITISSLDGFNEIEEVSLISVYPNPFNSKLKISNKNENEIYYCEIMDLKGNILIHKKLKDDLNINTQYLKSGVYLIKIYNKKKSFYKKIIKY